MTTFSKNLKFLRTQKELSQKKLAEELELTKQRVASWEIALSYPHADVLMKLGEYFNINLYDLLNIELEEGANYNPYIPRELEDLKIYEERQSRYIDYIIELKEEVDNLQGKLENIITKIKFDLL